MALVKNYAKYTFSQKDVHLANAEKTIALLLDNGADIRDPRVQGIVSAVGRRWGGDYALYVQKHNDGTHNVWIEET